MGTTIDALRLVICAILSTKPWVRDPNVAPIPWRQHIIDEILSGVQSGEKLLKFGIFWTDGVVRPHPPVSRGLRMVVDVLRRAGHKV